MRASPLSAGVRRRCRGCERTTRDAVKAAHPLRLKALSLIQRHADRYIALGGVTSRAEFRTDCRFDLARVEDGLRDAWKEGAGRCEACQIPYTGLADVTLDIHDRERRWFFGTNTRWLCAECNSEKRHSNPDEWGAVLWSWEEWVRVRNAGPTQGDLFSIG
jgi:hypothetical protein